MTNVCKWKTMCNLKNTIHYQRDASENWKSRYAFSAFIFFSFPYISLYFFLFYFLKTIATFILSMEIHCFM